MESDKQIKWHSPDEEPTDVGQWHLLTIKYGSTYEVIPALLIEDEGWYCFDSFNEYLPVKEKVYSWAELPAPYVPKVKK